MKTKKDIQNYLNISGATIHNWLKTGVIPNYQNGKYYTNEEFTNIISDIKEYHNKLSHRANRTKSEKTSIATIDNPETKSALKTVIHIYENFSVDLQDFMFTLATIILKKHKLVNYEVISSELKIECQNIGFLRFLNSWQKNCKDISIDLVNSLESVIIPKNEKDFLGICYESLRSLGEKSIYGAFFTPQKILQDLKIEKNLTVCDPCSGTGSILLKVISKNHNPENIFLRDIDLLALNIARVNFAIFFRSVEKIVNIEKSNVLENNEDNKFDVVISNPPFGAKLSYNEKKALLIKYDVLKTSETFSIALFNSLKSLNSNGRLIFILPESFLYVKTHYNIRKYIFQNYSSIEIKYFGKAFKGVMSGIVRICVKKSGSKKVIIKKNDESLELKAQMLIKNEFRPPFVKTQNEISILEKIFNTHAFYLKGKAQFGLGIVTGNNRKHLKTNKNDGMEAIFTGKELLPYNFSEPRFYIDYEPQKMQQVAATSFYRQPKICYKFISDRIVTCVDNDGVLILNSINFLIPEEQLSFKAISAFLNSKPVSYIYKSLFNSTKVLRKHIESIPIPYGFYDNIKTFEELYDFAHSGKNIKEELNNLVCNLYGISKDEAEYF